MSESREKFLQSFDQKKIFCRVWDDVKNPKATIMILHGMVEHSKRYEAFAQFLNEKNYIVFACDLRGHGKTVGDANLVGKYDGDIFKDNVQDAIFFANALIEKYKLPLIVLGHSYGGFLLQSFIEQYDRHSLAIFSGSANMQKDSGLGMGLAVAGITRFFCGKNAPAKLIYNLSFKKYGKQFKNGNWLTGDNRVWQEYQKDAFCGNICSANFYYSMFKNIKKGYKEENLNNIDKNKPLLIISGDLDPVGKEGLLAARLKALYDNLGVKKVNFKLFKDCRHEILNETKKQTIWKYLSDYCDKTITRNI